MKFFKFFFRPLNAKTAEADQTNSGRRSYQGFTLVELVVVIAVLAILAGVGSVAYRGYIKKANECKGIHLLL